MKKKKQGSASKKKSLPHFTNEMDNTKYSGYPASEFPKQCGIGFGGHGHYGTYKSCATNDHAHANHVDYDPSIVTCGSQPERPKVSSCAVPRKVKSSAACSVETFTGQGAGQIGCAMPEWWADKSCAMPPKHCGALTGCGVADAANPGCQMPKFWAEESCNMPPTHCGAQQCGRSGGVENYDGAIGAGVADEYPGALTAACGMTPVTLPEVYDCDAKLELRHDPGCCTCLECMAPYSMPYAPGPGCGKRVCRCGSCDGSCERPNLPQIDGMFGGHHMKLANILIALIVAAITYKLLTRI